MIAHPAVTRALALLTLAVAVLGVSVPLEHLGGTDTYTAFEMSIPRALVMTAPAIALGIGFGLAPTRVVRLGARWVGPVASALALGVLVGQMLVTSYYASGDFFEDEVGDGPVTLVGWEPSPLSVYPYVLAVLAVATALAALQVPARSRTANDAITIADPSGAPGPG